MRPMIRLASPVLLGLAALALTACSAKDDAPVLGPMSAEETLRAAVEKMDGLSSYRMVIADDAPPDSLPDAARHTVDIDRDAGFRLVGHMVDGPITQTCEDIRNATGVVGQRCKRDPPQTFEESGVVEFLVLKNRIHVRDCSDENEGCGEWKDREPHYLGDPLTGPGWFMPEYPMFVLRRAEDVEAVAPAESADPGELRLSGRFDSLRTWMASVREWVDENRDVPGFSEVEATFEEPGDEEYRFPDDNPWALEVVISVDDGLVHRMSFQMLAGDSLEDAEFIEVEVTFSQFNETEVKRPY